MELFNVGASFRTQDRSSRSPRPGAFRTLTATVLAVLALYGGLSGAAVAQALPPAGPLTLDFALRAARERSQALVAQDAAASAARDMAVAARQLPDPMLSVGVSNVPVSGPERFSLTQMEMTMRSVGVMQEFSPDEKRQARAARFEREAEVAREMRALQLTRLRRDTAQAWLDRYYRQQMVELLKAQRDEARLQIEAADALYRSGRSMQADAFMARSALAQIEDRIRQADAELLNSTIDLARWIGPLAQQPLAGQPPITQTHLQPHTLEGLVNHHPELEVMAAREAVARAEAEVARQDKRPDVNVELMYSQRGPSYSNMVSLGVSVPLQWNQKNRQDRELAARLAMAEQMRAERAEMQRQHLAEVRRWHQTWRSQLERLDLYDRSLIPLAAERTRAALAAYRGGTGPLAAVLDARRMEIDTRMERLRMEMETAGLWAQLEYLVPPEHESGAVPRTPENAEK
ncbi:TolC family protein [Caldimonas tepidiphila]|uniref:TolC family protein n=1 Tax=Caldimonas tepidiphila TaxID=2315841 RepID=UPI000E5B7D45|nr:TolC family protein [Caldimonas tepidiphila]